MTELQMTFPKILLHNAQKWGKSKAAIREKDFGIWQSYSWQDYLDQVRDFALGLAAMGFKRNDKLAIIGDNRPQLYWGMAAAQCLGGVPVPLYQDAIHKELHFIIDHAECRFALAEDQEQTDKLMLLREEIPRLEYIIYDDPRGLRTTSTTGCWPSPMSRKWAATSARSILSISWTSSTRWGPTTRPSWCTPRAPPATPRASSSRTATSPSAPGGFWAGTT